MKKLAFVVVIALFPVLASAQVFEYAAKYVCGRSGGSGPFNFAAGRYYTSINVHSSREVGFQKIFTVSLPSERSGGRTKEIDTGLGADQSMQIDCDNIFRHLKENNVGIPTLAEGYVIIRSKLELDVIGVYTASAVSGQSNLVPSMHMDRVPARQIR
jgi:hypothetical protein